MYFRERLGQLSWLKESLNDIDRYVSHHFQVSDLSIVSVYLGVTISHAATIGLSQVWRVRSAIDHSILLDDCDWKGHRRTSSDEQLPLETQALQSNVI